MSAGTAGLVAEGAFVDAVGVAGQPDALAVVTDDQIATEWAKTENGFTVKVTVPVSCEAELLLPAEYNGKCVKCALTESGKPASETLAIGEWERGISVALTSGTWEFNC